MKHTAMEGNEDADGTGRREPITNHSVDNLHLYPTSMIKWLKKKSGVATLTIMWLGEFKLRFLGQTFSEDVIFVTGHWIASA